eukprot:CAMPEP_0118955438 /NCGR_PEP_ID=MMETSP1169-20130426/59966_1 /TAXON_ID=36882 /ORGANISM="Pyramimonas obovata, Strain CCMP722" /LENGTH=51 /DNA_ID=CAMNT_0006903285 /DNA_START=185 /DNA_END=337 /DNA_ORIENTATION=+
MEGQAEGTMSLKSRPPSHAHDASGICGGAAAWSPPSAATPDPPRPSGGAPA